MRPKHKTPFHFGRPPPVAAVQEKGCWTSGTLRPRRGDLLGLAGLEVDVVVARPRADHDLQGLRLASSGRPGWMGLDGGGGGWVVGGEGGRGSVGGVVLVLFSSSSSSSSFFGGGGWVGCWGRGGCGDWWVRGRITWALRKILAGFSEMGSRELPFETIQHNVDPIFINPSLFRGG